MSKAIQVSVAMLAGCLACGLPLWPIPYSEVSMPSSPSGMTWLVLGALAGLLAGWMLRARVRTPVLAVTAGFVLAVMLRVAIETGRDPTSHNLWPFEVAIAGGIGTVAALLGVLLARGMQRLLRA